MSTLTPDPPATLPPPSSPRRRGGAARRAAVLVGGIALIAAICVAALFGAAGNPPCASSGGVTVTTPTGPDAPGQFAAPLQLKAGHWYRIGATEYGGPGDPTSGVSGASGIYLPAHPDSFAELSVLDTNPADSGQLFSFQDANALGTLPYGTAIRVANGPRSMVLIKRDIGYGQGPGQSIPYRMDVWWQSAAQLGITKNPVSIELAPGSGSGALLGQLASSAGGPAASAQTSSCAPSPGGPLPITPGPVAQINPVTGIASAPAAAPAPVKLLIAAANQIIGKPYIWGGGHEDLNAIASGYDCSGSVEYALHQAGLYPPGSGPSSTSFESYYPAGPGQWITVYANAVHMWIDVAGIVLNTAWYAPVEPTSPSTGPRWQPGATAQEQIAGNAAAGHPAFSVTHPEGL